MLIYLIILGTNHQKFQVPKMEILTHASSGGCEKCWPKPTSSKRRRARRTLQKTSRKLRSCEILQLGTQGLVRKKTQPLKRGGRAAMDREQVATLLFIGERVDAARQCTWRWISGHDPSCGATPMIRVPSV